MRDLSKHDSTRLVQITERVSAVFIDRGFEIKPYEILTALVFVHARIVPLRLDDMLAGNLCDVLHDVAGIMRHLDRNQIRLNDCFLPRFANVKAMT